MTEQQTFVGVSPDQLEQAVSALQTVLGNRELPDLMNRVAIDERRWHEFAGKDASELFREAGIDIPRGVTVSFGDQLPNIPFPPPEKNLDLVVFRTFWWCYREDDGVGPRTCTLVSLMVPRSLVRKVG